MSTRTCNVRASVPNIQVAYERRAGTFWKKEYATNKCPRPTCTTTLTTSASTGHRISAAKRTFTNIGLSLSLERDFPVLTEHETFLYKPLDMARLAA